MKVRPGRWLIVTLIVLLSLVLAACTRPARPGQDETPTPSPASDTTGTGVITDTTSTDTTGTTGGGTDTTGDVSTITPPQPAEVTPEATEGADEVVATPAVGETTTEDAATPVAEVTATPVVTATPDVSTTPVVTTTGDTTAGETATGDTVAPTTGTPPATEVNHTVALGESLYRIGLQYGYSWTVLAQYNGITNPNYVTPGQVIKIPAAGTPTPTPTPGEQLYTVKQGDTLGMIAAAYGISWVQIAEANGVVNPNLIYPGQVLKIPSNTPGPAPQFSHVVKQGETLFLISLHYGVVWTQIAEANNITAPYVIFPGQTLVIPGGS